MAPQREWFEKDYYKVLGVSETAIAKEIKSAYRKLSRQYHPDANPGDAAPRSASRRSPPPTTWSATPSKRKEYDEVRRLGPAGGGFPGRRRARRASSSRTRATSATCSAACSAAVGGAAAAAAARARTAGRTSRPSCTCLRRRGRRASPPRCTSPATRRARTCHGTGRQAGHRAARVPAAAAGGACVDDNQGLFSFSSAVPGRAAAAGVDRSTTRARPAAAPASSAGPARSRSASRPGSTTASASG